LIAIYADGFGHIVFLERHCNQYAWAKDLETGEMRNPRRELIRIGFGETKE